MTEPSDANTLRGAEFRKLISSPKGWIWVALAVVAGIAAGFALGGGFVPGLVIAAFLVLIAIGIIFWVADVRAANAFYASYAELRGLAWKKNKGSFDGTSSFLKKGDRQKVNQMFTGPLADDIEGCLALYTYTEESTDSDGQRQDTDYPFTVVTVKIPESVAHISDLQVHRKSGFKALEGFEDAFRRKHERVTLESEALRDRYEIFVGKEQDPVWTRRLFSPSFIVWLTDTPPKKYGFELEQGYFVAFVPKHRNSTAGLDEMVETSCHIARRIVAEVADTTPASEREA